MRRPTRIAALAAAVLALAAPSAAHAQAPDDLDLSAPSAIVVETSTGAVPYARNPDQQRPIASVTKLMTALLTLESTPLSKEQRAIPYRPGPSESQIGLRAGERLTTADMLRGLLLASANDAAASLAVDVGGSRKAFVAKMNARARALKLRHTHFADPVGLEAASESSARDLVGLTLQLRRFPFFRKTVDTPDTVLQTGDAPRSIKNRNTLVHQYDWVTGVKTGHTSRAGYVLVASARRRGVSLVSVVLGAKTEAARNADSLALLRRGFDALSRRTAVQKGDVLGKVPIRYRRGAELSVAAARTVRRVVPRGVTPRAKVLELPARVEGPIRKGQTVGRAEILVGKERVGTVSLVAAATVPAAGVTQEAKDRITTPVGFAGVMILLAGSVGLLVRRRGRPRSRRPSGRRGAGQEAESTA